MPLTHYRTGGEGGAGGRPDGEDGAGGRPDAEAARALLALGNRRYREGASPKGDISADRRRQTASEGQHPYAVIVTCSDSRVPPEHLFSAGIGDLFVVRTAGNVVSSFELGSIEYGVEHLGCSLVVVLGHTHCGAVAAALTDEAHEGALGTIVDEIRAAIDGEDNAAAAEDLNIAHSRARICASPVIQRLMNENGLEVAAAKYDLESGQVVFLPLAAGA